MAPAASIHVLDFGVTLRDPNSHTSKPRVLQFDFCNKILFIIAKGQVKDAHSFADILCGHTHPQHFVLEIEIRAAPPIFVNMQSHDSREFVTSLLLGIGQNKAFDDTFECTTFKQGFLEKKGHVKWSPRYVKLLEICSAKCSINPFKITQIICYKSQVVSGRALPVNAIEISNFAVDIGLTRNESHTAFRIRTFFRSYDFRCSQSRDAENWVKKISEQITESTGNAPGAPVERPFLFVERKLSSSQLDVVTVSFEDLHRILKQPTVDLRSHFGKFPAASLEDEDSDEEVQIPSPIGSPIVSPSLARRSNWKAVNSPRMSHREEEELSSSPSGFGIGNSRPVNERVPNNKRKS